MLVAIIADTDYELYHPILEKYVIQISITISQF